MSDTGTLEDGQNMQPNSADFHGTKNTERASPHVQNSEHVQPGRHPSILEGNSQQYAYAGAEAAGATMSAPWKLVGALGRDAGAAVKEKLSTSHHLGDSGSSASDKVGEEGHHDTIKDGRKGGVDDGILRDIENGLGRGSMASPDVSADITTGGSGHYNPGNDALLRMEALSTEETRHLGLALWLCLVVATAFLLYEFIKKLIDGGAGAKSFAVPIINSVVGSICFIALSTAVVSHTRRVYQTVKFKKVWRPRRLRVTQLLFAEVFTQWVNLVFFLVPNFMAFKHSCFQPTTNSNIGWLAFVRWTCWNTIFLLSVIHAHNSNPIGDLPGAVGSSSGGRRQSRRNSFGKGQPAPTGHESGIDQPFFKFHWPKFVIWVAMEASTIAAVTYYSKADKRHGQAIPITSEMELCNPNYLQCGSDNVTLGLVSLMVFWAVLYFVLYVYYMRRALQLLEVRSSQDFRISNIIVRLQMRMRLPAFAFFIASIMLLWYVKPFSCSALVNTWFGMLPVQIAASGTVIAMVFVLSPKSVGDKDKDSPILQVWLQEHAWTEAEKPEKLAQRSSSLPPQQLEQIASEPMFVVETAMKCLYWALLAYDLHEANPPTLSFEDGMGLFKLENFHIFWDNKKGLNSSIKVDDTMGPVKGARVDPKMDTKVLVAWSKDTILLSFRGTASMANVVSDLQAYRTAHHPKRGNWWHRPLVHAGFQHAWRSNGLSIRVIEFIKQVMHQEGMKPNLVKFYVTGHSLGGALATLAAFDMRAIAKQYGDEANVSCYTFGAPRTGNRAFAREFMEMVPDCWHIINDQDIVARGAKFVAAFKRGGHRVLINPLGDMIVRPAAIEASLRLLPGVGSVAQHLLTSYVQSFVSVLLAQFSHKRIKGGSGGVVELARANGPIQKLLLDRAGLTFDDLVRAWMWGPGALGSIQQKPLASRKLDKDKESASQGVGSCFGCCSSTEVLVQDSPYASIAKEEDANVVDGGPPEMNLA